MSAATVPKLYRTVIDDVINNVREVFLDDGVDEQVLLELKQMWEKKLMETKAIEHNTKEQETCVTQIHDNNGQSNQTNNSSSRYNNTNRNLNLGNNQNFGAKNHQTQSSQSSQINSFQSQSKRSTIVHSQPQSQPQSQLQKQSQSLTAHSLTHSQASSASGSRTIAGTSSTSIGSQLNFAAGSMIPQSLFQYTTSEGVDGPKTVAILPQKVTFAFNPQNSGIQTVMSSPATAATLALPPEITASLLHQAAFNTGNVINVTQPQASVVQHTNQTDAVNNATTIQFHTSPSNQHDVQESARPNHQTRIVQLDGPNDSSDDDDDEDDDFRDNDDDHEDNDDDQNEDDNEYTGEEEEPLNSGDDVSDEDPTELFDTDNVVVCQYDKITRSRNKWKFHLKDGIMNLQGKDYVFQKAIGDAEW